MKHNSSYCEWCTPNRNGDYNMAAYTNMNNPEQSATIAVYGGQIVIEIRMTADDPPVRLAMDAKYCPMCGRRYTEGK